MARIKATCATLRLTVPIGQHPRDRLRRRQMRSTGVADQALRSDHVHRYTESVPYLQSIARIPHRLPAPRAAVAPPSEQTPRASRTCRLSRQSSRLWSPPIRSAPTPAARTYPSPPRAQPNHFVARHHPLIRARAHHRLSQRAIGTDASTPATYLEPPSIARPPPASESAQGRSRIAS
jgi:hypothetical protein